MGTPSNISLGPGRLYTAPLGTPLPTALVPPTAEPPGPWSTIGYTQEGSSFSYEFSSEDVEVAESLDPLASRTTSRTGSVTFSMAENTVRNLALAFNGGTVSTAAGVIAYEPPEPGTERRQMLVFISEDGLELWIFRQVFQSGSVSMDRRKGADKTLIPVEFALEKPSSGGSPFKALYAADRSGWPVGAAAPNTVAFTVSPTV